MTRAGHFLPFLQDRDHSNCQYLSVSCRFPTCRMMTFLLLSHLLQRPWESNVRQSSFNDCAQSLSRVRLFGAPWTAAHQAPLSMEFFRQEYWSGLLFSLLQGIFLIQGLMQSRSPALQAVSLLSEPPGSQKGSQFKITRYSPSPSSR